MNGRRFETGDVPMQNIDKVLDELQSMKIDIATIKQLLEQRDEMNGRRFETGDVPMQNIDKVLDELQSMKIDIATIKQLLEQRDMALERVIEHQERMQNDLNALNEFKATNANLANEVNSIKKMVWKITGGILLLGILLEIIVLWLTRTPIP